MTTVDDTARDHSPDVTGGRRWEDPPSSQDTQLAPHGTPQHVTPSHAAASLQERALVQRPSEQPASMQQPMTIVQLDQVMAIEVDAYEFPWSRANFVDSLAAGHHARLLLGPDGELWGYLVAMRGFEEVHLLNITVKPGVQGRGHARELLEWLVGACREQPARRLWLEVRESNARARRIYDRYGFATIGMRKGYYPAPLGRREDAVVMALDIEPVEGKGGDALD
jgi:[ribosomal protein S18]-alanine N-acetyltransferase